ncbi:OPT oligopeptide transporter protein-domain-containing protein [Melanogaster broomeanus]|nr:OPT oligopeptide transporter protein-domain-containing protein [Melanogaster broomeanus]
MSGIPNSLSGSLSSRSHRVLLRRPIGMIQAITMQQVGLNVITELIVGYALPGRPIAMNLGVHHHVSSFQTLSCDRMHLSQVVATVFAGTVQLRVQSWMSTNTPDMYSTDQPDGFICPSTQVFGTASIIWGVVGPGSASSRPVDFTMLMVRRGQCSPFSSSSERVARWLRGWSSSSGWRNSFIRYVDGTDAIPPTSAINYVFWAIVGFIFQYWICRKHFLWWTKYNLPRDGTIGLDTVQTWWGNTVPPNTADGMGVPYNALAEGATFGLSFFVLSMSQPALVLSVGECVRLTKLGVNVTASQPWATVQLQRRCGMS